jgi:hypothetical protein
MDGRMTLRINSRHPTADHALDAYFTPPCAVRALMSIEHLPKSVADPCAGSGAILDVLASAAHFVYGSESAADQADRRDAAEADKRRKEAAEREQKEAAERKKDDINTAICGDV